MNIKWNWGTKLFIAIVLFMSLIIGFVIVSFQNTVNLVEKDYYPKGQIYQQRLNEIKNASLSKKLFSFNQNEKGIIVKTPVLNADTASLYFFRPSDTKLDKVFEISQSDTIIFLDNNNFKRGKYLIKVYWNSNDVGYYFEHDLFFK